MAPANERQRFFDEQLWEAARNKGPKVIGDMIRKHHANPNQVSPSGQTLLHQAAQNEEHGLQVTKMLMEMMEFEVDPQVADIRGQTCLFFAARNGNAELCDFLILHDCPVNHVDAQLQTAIFYSVRNGHMAATEKLLKRGADLELKDQWGFTPIFWAAESGHVDMMKMLIQQGASTKHLSATGGDLFTSATGEAMNFSVNELGADPWRRFRKNQTNLFFAARHGDVAKVKILIESFGLDVNHQDDNGQTCLYYAATHGGLLVAQKILQLKADVLMEDKTGKTALAFLQQKPKTEQNPQILKLLSDAAKKQHKVPKRTQKEQRAAAAREQKKREEEAKARKKAEDTARAAARKRPASAEPSQPSQPAKRPKTLLKRKRGEAVTICLL